MIRVTHAIHVALVAHFYADFTKPHIIECNSASIWPYFNHHIPDTVKDFIGDAKNTVMPLKYVSV